MRIQTMEIVPGRVGLLARFDVQIDDQLALKGLQLSTNFQGEFRVYPPNLRGRNSAWLGPELAARLTTAACAEYQLQTGGHLPRYEQPNAA